MTVFRILVLLHLQHLSQTPLRCTLFGQVRTQCPAWGWWREVVLVPRAWLERSEKVIRPQMKPNTGSVNTNMLCLLGCGGHYSVNLAKGQSCRAAENENMFRRSGLKQKKWCTHRHYFKLAVYKCGLIYWALFLSGGVIFVRLLHILAKAFLCLFPSLFFWPVNVFIFGWHYG